MTGDQFFLNGVSIVTGSDGQMFITVPKHLAGVVVPQVLKVAQVYAPENALVEAGPIDAPAPAALDEADLAWVAQSGSEALKLYVELKLPDVKRLLEKMRADDREIQAAAPWIREHGSAELRALDLFASSSDSDVAAFLKLYRQERAKLEWAGFHRSYSSDSQRQRDLFAPVPVLLLLKKARQLDPNAQLVCQGWMYFSIVAADWAGREITSTFGITVTGPDDECVVTQHQ